RWWRTPLRLTPGRLRSTSTPQRSCTTWQSTPTRSRHPPSNAVIFDSLKANERRPPSRALASLSRIVYAPAPAGKTGSALRLTPAGWQWLGRTPAKGTRGGDSVQHAFLVHELARRIPRSTIETLSVDLVIPYNTADHAHLL